MKNQLVTTGELLGRPGWSRTLVRRLLGEPDIRKSVWGVTAKLYTLDRVQRAEATAAFQDAQTQLAMRRVATEDGSP
jgi:hypothetical protein